MQRGYKTRERKVQPGAYSGTVTHPKAGDIERGKAWRQVRRPSDIYEHAAEMRARKEGANDAEKATGTIFVKGKRISIKRMCDCFGQARPRN